MAQSKTARRKKAKRRTMRKPRTYLRVTNNNLNLNEDPNVKYELMEAAMNRAEYNAEQEARAKYYAVPKGTFRFMLQYYSFDENIYYSYNEDPYGGFHTVTTRPMPYGDPRKLPLRAMDLLRLIPYDQGELTRDIYKIQIFYKGMEPEEDYYCVIQHIPFSSRYSEPENYNSNNDEWNGYQYRRILRPRNRWLAYFLDPLDFFRYDYYTGIPSEADFTFWTWYSTVRFIRNLPHLEEKAEREESAVQTWHDSLLRHQRRVVEPMAAKFMKETKQVVPENVEHIIRSFI